MLRLIFVALLPMMIFGRPVLSGTHWLFEVLEMIGLLLLIAGVLGRFWSIVYIGGHKNVTVMRDRPYSMCRHPLYFFSMMAVFGFAVLQGSLVLLVVRPLLVYVTLSITAATEEEWLRATYGAAYDRYMAEVPRIIPDPRLFVTADQVTFGVGHLRRNLLDALVFLSLIPLTELVRELKGYQLIPVFPIW
ncbi:MAG: methyltransferase family protein [Gemmobacter sp.]